MRLSQRGATAAIGRDSLVRKWAAAVAITGLTALGARASVHLPFSPVPLTFQVFGVLLGGLLLGRKWGSIAQVQYLLLGICGAPVFAGGAGGPGPLLGLTGGYLISYPIAAWIAGALSERQSGGDVSVQRQSIAGAAALLTIYGLGCLWFAVIAHVGLSVVVLQGALIFLAWDAVKAAAAVAASRGLRACDRRFGSDR